MHLILNIFLLPIDTLGVEWDPRHTRLAMCTGNNKVYMWSPAGCLSVEVPAEGITLCAGYRVLKKNTLTL